MCLYFSEHLFFLKSVEGARRCVDFTLPPLKNDFQEQIKTERKQLVEQGLKGKDLVKSLKVIKSRGGKLSNVINNSL